MARLLLLVATRKGAWFFRGDGPRRTWRIDGPRFRIIAGLDVNIEREFPAATLEALASRGHNLVKLPEGYMDFGCSQIALKIDGGYVCASDARRDSLAVGF